MALEDRHAGLRKEKCHDLRVDPHPVDLLYDVSGKPLPKFLDALDDVVLIHTHDRLELTGQQILSFITNREGFRTGEYQNLLEPPQKPDKSQRKILFAVVDDSDQTPSTLYRQLLSEVAESLPNSLKDYYRISFIDKEHQKALVVSYKEYENINPLLHDLTSHKFGGIRAIQNISEIIMHFYSGFALSSGKIPLAHKLDDDAFPGNLIKSEGRALQVSNAYNFFGRAAMVLQNPKVNYIGRHPDGDSPSPIFTLAEVIDVFHQVFTATQDWDTEGQSNMESVLASLPLTTVNVNKVGYAQIPPWMVRATREQLFMPGLPGQAKSVGEFIQAFLPASLALIQRGINHMSLDSTTDAQTWYGPTGCISGVAVSYRSNNQFPPFPPFANQDILRPALIHGLNGGSVVGDSSILHLKNDGRPPLLADFANGLANPRHTFLLTVCIIEAMEAYLQQQGKSLRNGLSHGHTIFEDYIQFGGIGEKFIESLGKKVEALSRTLHKEKVWWRENAETEKVIRALTVYIDTVKAHLPQIMHEYMVENASVDLRTTAKELFDWWIGFDHSWQRALQFYRELGKKLRGEISYKYSLADSHPRKKFNDLTRRISVGRFSPPSVVRTWIQRNLGKYPLPPSEDDSLLQEALNTLEPGSYLLPEVGEELASQDQTNGERIFFLFTKLYTLWKEAEGNILQLDESEIRTAITFGSSGDDFHYSTLATRFDRPAEDIFFLRIGSVNRENLERKITEMRRSSASHQDVFNRQLQQLVIDQTKYGSCYFSLYQVPQEGSWGGKDGNRPHVALGDLTPSSCEQLLIRAFPKTNFLEIIPLHSGGIFIRRRDGKPLYEDKKAIVMGFVFALDTRPSSETVHGKVIPVISFI